MRNALSRRHVAFSCLFCSLALGLTCPEADFAQVSISSGANVVINEVLANEPGSSTKLEWVELHNADSIDHAMDGWAFVCKDDTTSFPSGALIPADGFLIIARQLSSEPPDSNSFEGRWGDNSGVWGDSPQESFSVVEANMSLTNSGGTIRLIDPSSNVRTFTWDQDCGDGVSMERVSSDEDIWFCCVSPDKCTPGKRNSVATTYSQKIELDIEPNPFSPDGDGFEDHAVFSYTLPMESNLTLKIYDIRGRLIKTLVDDEPCVSGDIAWDGKDQEGDTVRIGIYVVWAESAGNSRSQAKTTIVVARGR